MVDVQVIRMPKAAPRATANGAPVLVLVLAILGVTEHKNGGDSG
jgi:hypothetical protein